MSGGVWRVTGHLLSWFQKCVGQFEWVKRLSLGDSFCPIRPRKRRATCVSETSASGQTMTISIWGRDSVTPLGAQLVRSQLVYNLVSSGHGTGLAPPCKDLVFSSKPTSKKSGDHLQFPVPDIMKQNRVGMWTVSIYTCARLLFSCTAILPTFPGGTTGVTNPNLWLALGNESLAGISFGRFKES